MAQTVTILASTSAAVTGVLALNPVSKSTTVILTASGATSSNATVQVDFSLDDPSFFPIGGSTTATWALLSSAASMTASAVNGLSYTVLAPIAQVRVNSTIGSTGGVYAFTLRALQSVTA